MNTFNRTKFEKLSEATSDYAVSIYIPTKKEATIEIKA